jgi:hypothetical protein
MSPSRCTPTPVSNSGLRLLPRFTDPPALSCTPNEVVIQLTTTLVIPDYSKYYETPISQFSPTYTALPDGSLLTPPYRAEFHAANANLLIVGMLLMFFLRNVFVTGNFIRRARVKSKYLFHVLFASQLAGLAALIPFLVARFTAGMTCRTYVFLRKLKFEAIKFAYSVPKRRNHLGHPRQYIDFAPREAFPPWPVSLQRTKLPFQLFWNLGYKAYRCLNNSRLVTMGLAVWQCATGAMVLLDIATMTSERTLAGQHCFLRKPIGDQSCTRSMHQDRRLTLRTSVHAFAIWVCFVRLCLL